ncbi:glutathione S-transferase N-terminal domain-containing protein [Paracoccus mutanolyticus]|uniref:glutathione S-transferase N-terminal domain-containing protein n=1 Tax=Paracoccus mutanolyticus TaxID=1499308 RepID=UPI001CB95EDE|nr:glutathione S-transferase N-terminal domain-containing protein [Paracoccus mutanolyticus]
MKPAPLSRSDRVLSRDRESAAPTGSNYRLTDGSTRRPPYDAIHPVGRAPALRDGDTTIHESGAMTEWLCETRAPTCGARRARRGAWAGSTGCISAKPCASTWRT